MKMVYKRRDVQKAIILALRNLGGSASRNEIKKEITDSKIDGLDYEQVYFRKKTKDIIVPFYSILILA